MSAPTISVTLDADTMEHVIMVTSHGRTEPFGPRIFRAPPHPAVSTRHESPEAAEKDAAKIRAYLAALPAKKVGKTAARKQGA